MSSFINLTSIFKELPKNILTVGDREVVLIPDKLMLVAKPIGAPAIRGQPVQCNIHLSASKYGIVLAVVDTGATKSTSMATAISSVLKSQGKSILDFLCDSNGFPVDQQGQPRTGNIGKPLESAEVNAPGAFTNDAMKNMLEQRKSLVNTEYRRRLDGEFANFEKLAKNWIVQYTGNPKPGDVLFTYQLTQGFPQNLSGPFLEMLKEKGFETNVNKSKPTDINIVMK